MINHFIVDIETLGNGVSKIPGVFQIAALAFTVGETFSVEAEFSRHIRFDTVIADLSTLCWWMDNPSFKDHLSVCASKGASPSRAIEDFGMFVAHRISNESTFWANGTSFDPVYLKYLFEKFSDGKCPWKYWQERDLRTVNRLFNEGGSIGKKLSHDALRDCYDELDILSDLVLVQKRFTIK